MLGGARGVWRNERESMNIVRVLVEGGNSESHFIASIETEISRAVTEWSTSEATRQERFLYTVRELTEYQTVLELP